MQIGLREANQRFAKLIREVRNGKDVVITDRGKPVARITRIPEKNDLDAVMERLIAAGKVIPARNRRPMPAFKPFPATAESTTVTLSKMRDER